MLKSYKLIFFLLVVDPLSFCEVYLNGYISPICVKDGTHLFCVNPNLNRMGEYLVFDTWNNLVPQHPKSLYGNEQVYLYDRMLGKYELISVGFNGLASEKGISQRASISDDGRYVVYLSNSKELVEDDTTDYNYPGLPTYKMGDCFLRDRIAQKTFLITRSATGEIANQSSWEVNISGNGRFVVFNSSATNLIKNDKNESEDIFIYDHQKQLIRLVSLTKSHEQANSDCFHPEINYDGRFIVYASYATNWLKGEAIPNSPYPWEKPIQIILRDMETETTEIITKSYDGHLGNGNDYDVGYPTFQISDDGRFVAFISSANNLLPDLPSAAGYVYLYDRENHEMKMIQPVEPIPYELGNPYYGGWYLMMSGDGRYVFWHEWEGNHKKFEMKRYDRIYQQIDVVAYDSDAPRLFVFEPWVTQKAAVNRDGSVIVFASASDHFLPDLPRIKDYLRLFRMEVHTPFSSTPLWPDYR